MVKFCFCGNFVCASREHSLSVFFFEGTGTAQRGKDGLNHEDRAGEHGIWASLLRVRSSDSHHKRPLRRHGEPAGRRAAQDHAR